MASGMACRERPTVRRAAGRLRPGLPGPRRARRSGSGPRRLGSGWTISPVVRGGFGYAMASREQSAFLVGGIYVGLYVLVGAAGEVLRRSPVPADRLRRHPASGIPAGDGGVPGLVPQGGRLARTRPVLGDDGASSTVSTAGAWIGLFAGLKFVEPAIVVSLIHRDRADRDRGLERPDPPRRAQPPERQADLGRGPCRSRSTWSG